MAAVPARSGRHAAGRRSPAPAPSEPLDLDLDLGEDVTPDQVEEIADQMLTHLAATEPRPAFIDYDELPGGKWGAIAGGMVALIVMIMIGSVFLNLLFNR